MSKKAGKKLSVPREMAEIQSAYQQLCANAGQLQYQLKIQSRELDMINSKLEEVNREAAARMQLDKDASARKSTLEAVTTEEAPKAPSQEVEV